MKNIHKQLFVIVLLVELIVIGALFIRLKKSKNLAVYSKNVHKDFFSANRHSKYKHFRELIPGTETLKQILVSPDKNITYHTNEDTLNNLKDYPVKKPENTYRIVTLGDSFTYGYNVSTADNWSQILESRLTEQSVCGQNYEVINLGVPGYDVEYEVERYRLRGQKYNPDLIIWLVKDDDFLEPEEEIEKLMYEYGYDGSQEVKEYYSKAMDKVTENMGRQTIVNKETKALSLIGDYFKGEIVILTISENQKILNILKQYVAKKPTSHLLQIALGKGVIFSDFHPTEEGHAYIADKLYSYLKSGKFVCR